MGAITNIARFKVPLIWYLRIRLPAELSAAVRTVVLQWTHQPTHRPDHHVVRHVIDHRILQRIHHQGRRFTLQVF